MLLSLAYLANLVLYVLGIKALSFYYGLSDIYFSFILYGNIFPIVFGYFLYQQARFASGSHIEMGLQPKMYPINVLLGVLDYIQLILLYVGFSGVSVAQYLSYRNSSILINVILSYLFLDKTFCKYQKIGILLITISCVILFFMGSTEQSFYSLVLLGYSFIYSLIGFLMECYKETSNVMQVKVISTGLHMISHFGYSLFYNSVLQNPSISLIVLIIGCGSSEFNFYYLKNKIIQTVDNGSIYTNILDIIRRVITLFLGIWIFNETNPAYLYYLYGVMLLGCVLFYFNKEIEQRIEVREIELRQEPVIP
jgi:uncharacterized membrane protein